MANAGDVTIKLKIPDETVAAVRRRERLRRAAAVESLVRRMRAGETGGYGSHIERDLLALKR